MIEELREREEDFNRLAVEDPGECVRVLHGAYFQAEQESTRKYQFGNLRS
jgi:hypothetical protein